MNLQYVSFTDDCGKKNGYVITYNDSAKLDQIMAEKLNISLETYQDILKNCNAVNISDFITSNEYMFLNEDDVIKAIVMLKLVINNK